VWLYLCASLVILQIECYTNMEQSLQDQDLVLSCEDPGAWGQLHNAAMASTPGHPFWLAVLQEAVRRSPATAAANSSWLTQQLRKLWRQTPFHDRIVDVLQSTGPMLLSDVYQVRAHCGTHFIMVALTEQHHQVLGYLAAINIKHSWFALCCSGSFFGWLNNLISSVLVVQSYTGGMPACGHSVVANGMVSTAYPVGTWFTPCLCGDDECARCG